MIVIYVLISILITTLDALYQTYKQPLSPLPPTLQLLHINKALERKIKVLYGGKERGELFALGGKIEED